MKITVLNGNPDSNNNKFENYLHELSDLLISGKHEIKTFDLREMNIKYCIGCFYCWVKTPGECFVTDDSGIICREYMSSDFVLFASPVIMGFTSVILKKIHDKLLPLCIPYAWLLHNEVRHKPRYDKYPLIGVLLEKSRNTDEEDIKIISDIYAEDAKNLNTSLFFTKLTDDPVSEVVDEINCI